MSRIILSVSLASAIALSVVLPTQAAQPHCLTAELDPELVDSNLALSVGQCHLDAAAARSEERRVGKACRPRRSRQQKNRTNESVDNETKATNRESQII